jgi:hypothetical protein
MKNRPMGVFKISNDYQKLISNYDKIPKAIFAGIVVSFLLNYQGIEFENIDKAIIDEWRTLYENGIIPQKPIKI